MSSYRVLYARLLQAMSLEDARQILGFPPDYAPSPSEISKAFRSKALQNHPDRGGNTTKMMEINVAKDILEGKRWEDRTPVSPTHVDPEKARREEEARKVAQALRVIDNAEREVTGAIEACLADTDRGRGKVNLRAFLVDDYADALSTIQDILDDSPTKEHPDMRKADALCASLSNKSMRLGKKYLALVKLHGDVAASFIGLGGTEPITYTSLAKLYAEATKFSMALNDLFQESRKLMGLINTSEDVPIELEDLYHKPHSMLSSFGMDWLGLKDQPLKAYGSILSSAVRNIGTAVQGIGREGWKNAPSSDSFSYPDDFAWARDLVNGKAKPRTAAMATRIAERFLS